MSFLDLDAVPMGYTMYAEIYEGSSFDHSTEQIGNYTYMHTFQRPSAMRTNEMEDVGGVKR